MVAVPVTAPPRKARRQELFEFLKQEAAAGRWPTRRAMADHMGWKNPESCVDALWALVKDGRLIPSSWSGRNIKFRIAGIDSDRAAMDGAEQGEEP